jgi:hypothetical protein
MLGRDFLGFVRVQIVQIGLGQLARALLGHGALDHGHGVLATMLTRVDGIDLALAEFAVHRHTSDSKVISTSPMLRCRKMLVASRPPLPSTGTFL